MSITILDELNAIKDQKLDEEVGLPGRKEIVYLLKEAQVVLFPEFFSFSELSQEEAFYELKASLEKKSAWSRKGCVRIANVQENWWSSLSLLCRRSNG